MALINTPNGPLTTLLHGVVCGSLTSSPLCARGAVAAYDLVWGPACAPGATGIVDAVTVMHLDLKVCGNLLCGGCVRVVDCAGGPLRVHQRFVMTVASPAQTASSVPNRWLRMVGEGITLLRRLRHGVFRGIAMHASVPAVTEYLVE